MRTLTRSNIAPWKRKWRKKGAGNVTGEGGRETAQSLSQYGKILPRYRGGGFRKREKQLFNGEGGKRRCVGRGPARRDWRGHPATPIPLKKKRKKRKKPPHRNPSNYQPSNGGQEETLVPDVSSSGWKRVPNRRVASSWKETLGYHGRKKGKG